MLNQLVRSKQDPLTLALKSAPPIVTPRLGYYTVTYPDFIRPGMHLVRKDKACLCGLGKACPAVQAVAAFLQKGGSRAPDVPVGQLIPEACPICGGAIKFEPRLCSPVRGAGWVCLAAASHEHSALPAKLQVPGESHFWQFKWIELFKLIKEQRQ